LVGTPSQVTSSPDLNAMNWSGNRGHSAGEVRSDDGQWKASLPLISSIVGQSRIHDQARVETYGIPSVRLSGLPRCSPGAEYGRTRSPIPIVGVETEQAESVIDCGFLDRTGLPRSGGRQDVRVPKVGAGHCFVISSLGVGSSIGRYVSRWVRAIELVGDRKVGLGRRCPDLSPTNGRVRARPSAGSKHPTGPSVRLSGLSGGTVGEPTLRSRSGVRTGWAHGLPPTS